MARCWYSYIFGNPFESSSYYPSTQKPSCITGNRICAIYAYDCDFGPIQFSDRLMIYISNALITGVPQPNIPIRSKKFVYLRP